MRTLLLVVQWMCWPLNFSVNGYEFRWWKLVSMVKSRLVLRWALSSRAAISLVAADMLDTLDYQILPIELTAVGASRQTNELMGVVTLQVFLCDITSTFEFPVVLYLANHTLYFWVKTFWAKWASLLIAATTYFVLLAPKNCGCRIAFDFFTRKNTDRIHCAGYWKWKNPSCLSFPPFHSIKLLSVGYALPSV